MRVDAPLSYPDNVQSQTVGRSGSTAQPNHAAPVETGQDQAQFSIDNNTLQNLNARLSQVPEIRQDRVDALRQSLSNGSYQVSDQQLSNAMGSDLLGKVIG